jgi:hypothetical protein
VAQTALMRRHNSKTGQTSPATASPARAVKVQDLLEDRAVGAGAAGGLGEHPVAAGTLQGVDLELRLLVCGGDAGLAKQVTHAAYRRRTL